MKTCASIFSGGGGWDLAAMAAGYTPIWAVECESAIADVYEANIGKHVIRDLVQCVDPTTLEVPDLFCASPVCTSFSIANKNGQESELDILCAHAVARFLRVLSPPRFVMENVSAYAKSKSMDIIRAALQDVYGWWDEGVFNSADSSVPQTRKRFIVRANGGFVIALKKAHRWIGWYESISDIIHTLPPSQFADWQLNRLSPDILESVVVEGTAAGVDNKFALPVRSFGDPIFTVRGTNPTRAFLVDEQNASRDPTIRDGNNPAFTMTTYSVKHPPPKAFLVGADSKLTTVDESEPSPTVVRSDRSMNSRAFIVDGKPANYEGDLCIKQSCEAVPTLTASQEKHPFRAWLSQGRVVAMTPRALARFMSFPDWYALPQKKSLACTILGNAVCPLMGKAIIESLD